MPQRVNPEHSPAAAASFSRGGGSGPTAGKWVWLMLGLRSGLSLAILLALAAYYRAAGDGQAFRSASAWWLWIATAANFACLFALARLGRREGLRLREIYRLNRTTWKGDVAWFLLAGIGSALFALPPGTLLAGALWEDPGFPNGLLFGPIPLPAVYPLFLLMPLTQALAELPTYWGYVAPRLRSSGMNRWLVIGLAGFALSFQHLCFSFQPDLRYSLWLALKFLPFALWTGFVLDRRPTVLPYLMALHFLMDASLPFLQLLVSQGRSITG